MDNFHFSQSVKCASFFQKELVLKIHSAHSGKFTLKFAWVLLEIWFWLTISVWNLTILAFNIYGKDDKSPVFVLAIHFGQSQQYGMDFVLLIWSTRPWTQRGIDLLLTHHQNELFSGSSISIYTRWYVIGTRPKNLRFFSSTTNPQLIGHH